MSKPVNALTSGEMVAISSALLEPPKRDIVASDELLLAFLSPMGEVKELLLEAMQTQESSLSDKQRTEIRQLIQALDAEYDFNARALYHLLDKLGYAFPSLRDDFAYASSVIFRDGLKLINASAMHEAGEAERMAAEVANDERVKRVLAYRVVNTPLSDYFEKTVTLGLQMKEAASRLEADEQTSQAALSEVSARHRWVYVATTFLRAVRMSKLAEADKATLYQLFGQAPPAPAAR